MHATQHYPDEILLAGIFQQVSASVENGCPPSFPVKGKAPDVRADAVALKAAIFTVAVINHVECLSPENHKLRASYREFAEERLMDALAILHRNSFLARCCCAQASKQTV